MRVAQAVKLSCLSVHRMTQAAQNTSYKEKRAAGDGANARMKVKTEETAESEQEALDAVGVGSASLMRRCSWFGTKPCTEPLLEPTI